MTRHRLRSKQLIVVCALAALAGCSLKLELALFNNAGEPIAVRLRDRQLPIALQQSARFDYPTEAQEWALRLVVANCEVTYRVPQSLEHYPWRPGSKEPLKAQVERDFSIVLLPPTAAAPVAAGEVAALQRDGFPLQPATKRCG